MKRNIILLFISVVALFAACSVPDKGNYDYHEINEVTISGINPSYTVMPDIQTLTIDPAIKMTDAEVNDSRFDYLWLANVAYGATDTLGRERVLSTTVSLAPRTYQLVLKVFDNKTGVVWRNISSLVVGNMYEKGIMLAGEGSGGVAQMQMISMATDTIVTPDILAESGLPQLRGPVAFFHTGPANATNVIKVWVLTESGSYYIDRTSMKGTEANNFRSTVFATDPLPDDMYPVVMGPQIKNKSGATGMNQTTVVERAVICNNGYVFNSTVSSNGDFYTSPGNRTNDNWNELLKAKPYMMYGVNTWNGFLWYDETYERFMRINKFNKISFTLTDLPDDMFPWNQAGTGRTLVYAENTFNVDGGSEGGNSFALMKDGSGNYFIYKFYVGEETEKRDMYEVKSVATGFAQATMYAFSSRRTVMFYVSGGKLYAYDYNKGNEKCYELNNYGTGEITMIKADTQIDPSLNPLYIATYSSSTGGTLQKFTVGTNPDYVDITPSAKEKWSGLTRIKNMSWRAAN